MILNRCSYETFELSSYFTLLYFTLLYFTLLYFTSLHFTLIIKVASEMLVLLVIHKN